MSDFYVRKDVLSQYQPLSAIFAPLRTGAGIEKAPPTGLYSNVLGVSTDLSDIYDQGVAQTDLIRYSTGIKSKGFTRVDGTVNPDLQLVFRGLDVSPTPTPSIGATPTPTQTPTRTQTPTPTITPSPTRPPGPSQSQTQTPTKSPVTGTISGGISISAAGENIRRGTGTIGPINVLASFNTNIFKIIVEERSGSTSASQGSWRPLTTNTNGGNTVSFSTSFVAAFVGFYQFRATAYNNANIQIGQAVTGSVQVIPNDISIYLNVVTVGNTITVNSNASSGYSLTDHAIQQYNSATGGWGSISSGTSNSLQSVLTGLAAGGYLFRSVATASQLKESSMYKYSPEVIATVGTSVVLSLSVSPGDGGTISATPSTVTNTSTHTIVGIPSSSYDFSHFLVDGVNVTGPNGSPTGGNTSVSMNNQSHSVVAVFKLKNVAYAVIPSPSNGGTGSGDLISPVPVGSVVNLSNTPATNYNFKNYTVNGSPIGSNYQLTTNTTIFANFQLNAGVLLREECLNSGVAPYTLRKYYSNGTGGETFTDTNNSPTCGYVAPPAAGTLLSTYCSGDAGGNPAVPGVNKWGNYADGSGGSTRALIQNNSTDCGYQPPPAAGIVLRVTCIGTDAYYVRADGGGGEVTDDDPFSTFPAANSYCFYTDGTPIGTTCIPREASIDLYQVVANGTGGTRVGALLEQNSIACGYNPAPNPVIPEGPNTTTPTQNELA
jgi:hypothetical protein